MSDGGRHRFLGLPLDALTMDETLARAEELIASGGPHQHVVLNAAKVVMAADDPELAAIISGCALVNADGASIVWGARARGIPVPERVTGIDLFQRLVARAAARGWRPYFLGAREEVLAEAVARLRARHPGLDVAGARDGYWSPQEEEAVVAEIAAARPDLLLVAIPSPRKERFLAERLTQLGVPFAMGIGGALDVVAGRTRRAPVPVQRLGLEWLYRLAQEPRRMWRRYLVGNTRFCALVAREWWHDRGPLSGRARK